MTYAAYAKKHPVHMIYPVKDFIRGKWGVNKLVDPRMSASELIDRDLIFDQHNKLAWLFSCNTVELLNKPSNLGMTRHGMTTTSGVCAPHEILVRLSLTANFEEQVVSLRRQIGKFFTGGARDGYLIHEEHPEVGRSPTAKYSPSLGRPVDLATPQWKAAPLASQNRLWNSAPLRLKSLHYVVRMADAIAAMEQGRLSHELKDIDIGGVRLRIRASEVEQPERIFYPMEVEGMYPEMSALLHRYFEKYPLGSNAPDPSEAAILRWLYHAEQFVVSRDYVRIARTSARVNR